MTDSPKYRFTTYYTVGDINPMVHSTTCYAETGASAQDGASVPLPDHMTHKVVGGKLEKFDERRDQYFMVTEFGITTD